MARTDHNSLRWLRNFREPEGQVARWLERLAEFDFEVMHRPGRKHQNADALSRRVCKQCGLESSPAEESDKELRKVREWSTQKTWPQAAPEGSRLLRSLWSQRDRIVMHEGTICRKWETPDTGETRLLQVIPRQRIPEILAAIHNRQSGAHLGVAKTLAKVRQRYYWPQQREDVEDWCRACQTCAARAVLTKKPQAPMQLQPVGYPFQRVGIDIVGPLEETQSGNRYTLVVCDYFSKWPETFALPNAEARTVATALVNGIFCRYGAPETLHSDQGRNFESELVKEVCQLFGVAKTRTTAYHPQSDGLVERMNRILLDLLAKASIDHPDDWDAHLDRVLLAYRSSVHHTTGATPSRVVFGRELRLPVDERGAPEESVGEYTRRLRQDLEQLYEAVRGKAGREQRRQKFWKDRKAHGPVYEPGDQVWMQVPAKTKLGAYWDGPYEVQKKLDWNTYRVKEMKGGRQRLVVHFDRLKPYHGSRQPGGAHREPRKKRETRRPPWLRDFIHDPRDQHGTCSRRTAAINPPLPPSSKDTAGEDRGWHLATGPYDPTRQYQLAIKGRKPGDCQQDNWGSNYSDPPWSPPAAKSFYILERRREISISVWSASGDRRRDVQYLWKRILRMSTRRRDRMSKKEPAQSDGERTGADPEETNQPTPPGGSLQYSKVMKFFKVF
ncbi:Retrovirus-related Pol polyprotein from transposon [Trichinella zimbabwensis]|uniref:RNA-directed DNA polymerase n=1 Tax=Trichinella zimbabwensis TaxID=268475 RepID=A0A0V1HSF9_9BILA|nr:Retrovirus-related Pol polyprotein from transposon [Trichinella zimbabwensis]